VEILLEIGIEEIPARFLKPALNDIEKYIKKELKENRVVFDEVKTYGTPRRLVLHVTDLTEKQESLDIVNTGPAKHIAFNESGELTKAGLGFVKSQGINATELDIIETPKGEYVAVRKFIEGKDTKELLPTLLTDLITSLTFPKSMKWSDKEIKFVRPIQWILALADNELININIDGIESKLTSRGHRFFGEAEFDVLSVYSYFEKVRNNYVIIDIEERKNKILSMINEKCNKKGEQVLIRPALLDEVTNLVEYPYPIVGTFNSEFLEVPQDILIISMEVHQRYFPILDENGKLLPKFVVVRNGIEDSEHVRSGNEKVLSARLSDARFFYQEDLKRSLDDNVEKLKSVVFQKDLGTIYQKVTRSKKLAEKLLDKLNLNSQKETTLRTIHLSKADLVSNMIGEKEFTKLQGFMGAEYALKSGEKEEVAKGIEEHYYPRYQGDVLPQGIEGRIAGICDRMDTLAGCLGVGIIPSGSKDPFALRRASLGIINIILDAKLDISLEELTSHALDVLEEDGVLKKDKEEVRKSIIEFFYQRIITVFVDKGYHRDIVKAVLTVNNETILEAEKKIKTLTEISKEDNFVDLIQLLKRIKNIAKSFAEENVAINTELFETDAESNLYNFFVDFENRVEVLIRDKDYKAYFGEILKGKDSINNFFDNVMVMAKEENIKNNRLSLLKSIDTKFNLLADLSLVGEK